MRVIRPSSLTLDAISESEDDAPVWAVGTSYNIGDSVILNGAVYVSTIDANLGLNPEDEVQELEGARWLLRGATNIRKFLDNSPSTKTVGTSPLVIDVVVSDRFNSLALFGLSASKTTVEVISGLSTTLVGTINTGAEPVNNWWDWLNTNFYKNSDRSILTGITAGFAGATVRLTLEGPEPSLGELVVGRAITVGATKMESATKMRRRTFTRINENDFGDVSVTKRAIARDVTYGVASKREGFSRISQFLDSVDGVRVVTFVGNDWSELTNYGFITDWELPAEMPEHFFFEITTQGVK